MSFHLGKPILVMIFVSLTSGAVILMRPAKKTADMTVWVFADSHAKTYRDPAGTQPSLVGAYTARTGLSVNVDLINTRALDIRLVSLFNSQSRDVPDLVEVEISSIGKFFRPPLDEVGFLDLTDRLRREGILEQVVKSRFTPWSKKGHIFGVPHDLHPVSITYRKDLFDAAGIDLAKATTWAQFHEVCLRFQQFYKDKGVTGRYAFESPSAVADNVYVMLLQRGINIVDDDNKVHINDPKVADTLVHYAQWVEGKRRIAADATPGGTLWVRDLAQGDLCSAITPDWKVAYIVNYGPELKGKIAMMPLPRFDPSDAPTSTWGGTMLAIPKNGRDPDRAWDLLKHMYFSDAALEARQRHTKILPPVKAHWKSPVYHDPYPFFGGQKIDELYIELADQIPARYVTPFTAMGTATLSVVLNRAVSHVRSSEFARTGEEGLRKACQAWLNDAAADLERRIEFGTFE